MKRALDPGLCADCRWSRLTGNRRGSNFWLCELSKIDSRFPRYPRLPVLRCSGYEPEGGDGDATTREKASEGADRAREAGGEDA